MVVAAAKGRKIENEPLARSLDALKELLYDADDVMDELDYYRLKLQVESVSLADNSRGGTSDAANNTEAKSTWLSSSIRQLGSTTISSLRTISSTGSSRGKRKREDDHDIAASSHLEILENRSEFSSRIKHIATKLEHLGRDVRKTLGIDRSNSAGTSNLGRYHDNPTTSYLVEPRVYGRDEEMESIIKLMENNRSNDITVVPIVGVGGVGKTTLAQLVYRSPMVESQFQIKIWICVSDKFDVTRLVREMLECASGQKQAETGNLNKLQEDLEKQVKSRRFLIVFDDVWDDMNQDSWDKLLAPLRCNQAMGNMILVTTRKLSIADMTKTIGPVMLNALERDDLWLLFKLCAFGNEEYEDDQGLCVIGKQITKHLGGNPLAVKTVGALLKRNISVDNWSNILNNQEWKSTEVDGIMPALKISYDYLPEHLQQCFRYCCLFPKDYCFDEVKLIRIWISQGFVHGSHTGKKQEDVGKGYFTYLVNSGFFQHNSYSTDTFVMHDLLHDLACQISGTDFVTIDGSECAKISPTTRHLSIVFDSAHSEASENFERKLLQITSVRKLRSLVLIGYYDSRFSNCFKIIFKEGHNLRYLKIKAFYPDFVPFFSNLGCCTHVRYIELDVCGSNDKVLPEPLVNFFHLQVLEVGWLTKLPLPNGMSNLVSMQHLIAPKEVHSSIANIGKLTALQELPMFKVQVQNDSGFDMRQLKFMSQLVKLEIYQLENVQSKQEASEARLIDKVYLEDVCFSWDNSSTSSGPSTETATNVLEGLRPHRSLKHLQIIGYNSSSPPSWLATGLSVTSLQSLRLEKCIELGVLPPLLKLPFLRKLELINMPGIVEVEIPCLGELMLIEMPRLEKCVTTSNSELNCRLQSLIIEKCPELNDFAPFTSENFCSFEVIQDSGMSQLESYSAEDLSAEAEKKKWLPVLDVLRIHGCPCLKLIRALPPSSNTRLSIEGLSAYPGIEIGFGNLSVKSSDDLKVLDEKILAFQNIKDVTSVQIENCPNLVFLSFEGFRQLNNLREMTIYKCGNLVSSCIAPSAVSETWRATTCPAFPRLEYLKIESCDGIAGKWLTEMLLHMQSLEELYIVECPKIKSLSIQKAEGHNLASSSECEAILLTILAQHEFHLHIPLNVMSTLQKFNIEHCPEMQLCGSEGFGGFTCLTSLVIKQCPMLLSSADEIFSLPASLPFFWIEHPPKNLQPYFLGNRTLLKELHVFNSPDVQFLRLHSCTSLERFCISNCRQVAVLEGLQYLNSLRF
ncbi:unnamed protein product [Urochloa decumbens]|uniref:NB-ARC domain-containing protein n=1 Tax=Urochloa decumbens TaxID=240449 RepID=A0ABC9B9M0_9POAL